MKSTTCVVRLLAAGVLALSAACSVSASGQIPCADDSSCPASYPVCQAGKCVEGPATGAASVQIVGVPGKALTDPLRATVNVQVVAKASSGVKTLTLDGGGKTYSPDASSAPPLFVFVVDTTKLSDGSVSFTATLTPGDPTQATKTSSAVSLVIDNTAPGFTGLPAAVTVSTAPASNPTDAHVGSLVTLDVTPSEPLSSLTAAVTNGAGNLVGQMAEIAAPTGLTRHFGFAVSNDVQDVYTVTLTPTDLAGNAGTAVTRSFNVDKAPSFSGNHFAVTYSQSGNTLITSGSSTGTYTFTIPTLGSAATASISDGTRTYGTSTAIKGASGTPLTGIPVVAAAVTGNSILFTLAISNPAGATITQTASLLVIPAPTVSGFSLSPTTVTDGSPVTVTATIGGGTATLSGTGFATTPVQSGDTFVPPAGAATTDFMLTVKNAAGDAAGTVQAGPASVTSVPAPSFGTGVFAVTWSGSGNPVITAGSTTAQGTYSISVPHFVNAGGTATIKDNFNNSYSDSASIKAAAATTGTLSVVAINQTAVASPGLLTFTLTIANTAATAATVIKQAAITVLPAPTVSGFSLSPGTVTDGSPVTVTATIGGGTATLAGTGFPSTPVQNGSTFVPPAGATTSDFMLTVKNAAGDTAGTVQAGPASVISVPAPSFGAGSFAVTWTASGSTLITAGSTELQGGTYTFTIPQFANAGGTATIKDNFNNSYSDSGSIKTAAGTGTLNNVTMVRSAVTTPGTTLTFTLTISNTATTAATVIKQASLTVIAPPTVSGFTLTPATVTDGSPVTVNATISANSTATLTATGFTTTPVQNGSTIIAPASANTTDFLIKVKNAAGDPAGTVQAGPQSVNSVPAPAIVSFSASNQYITAGVPPYNQTLLFWTFTGGACGTAANCRIDNFTNGTTLATGLASSTGTGLSTGPLTASSIFLLTVKNAAGDTRGTVTAQLTITQTPAPTFTGAFAITSTNPSTFGSTPTNVTFQSPTYNNSTGTGTIWDGAGNMVATIGSNATTTSPATIAHPTASTTYYLVIENLAGVQAVQSAFVEVKDSFFASRTPSAAKFGATATLLPSGRVFIAGGGTDTSCSSPTAAAFLYDPHTDSYTSAGAAGNMNHARCGHTATLLPDGTVLITGGSTDKHVEVYTPNSGAGTFAADSTIVTGTARRFHTATLAPCSNVVLLAGGIDLATAGTPAVNTTEKIGLTSGGVTGNNFSSLNTKALNDNRSQHTATFFSTACQILIAGGSAGGPGKSADLYTVNAANTADVIVATKTAGTDMVVSRSQHTATLLNNGTVLLAGGIALPATTPLQSAEVFTLGTQSFTSAGVGSMTNGRTLHTATMLSNGKVLMAGGTGGTSGSGELYTATGATASVIGNMTAARSMHTATPLFNGFFLMWGGNSTTSAELFDPE